MLSKKTGLFILVVVIALVFLFVAHKVTSIDIHNLRVSTSVLFMELLAFSALIITYVLQELTEMLRVLLDLATGRKNKRHIKLNMRKMLHVFSVLSVSILIYFSSIYVFQRYPPTTEPSQRFDLSPKIESR